MWMVRKFVNATPSEHLPALTFWQAGGRVVTGGSTICRTSKEKSSQLATKMQAHRPLQVEPFRNVNFQLDLAMALSGQTVSDDSVSCSMHPAGEPVSSIDLSWLTWESQKLGAAVPAALILLNQAIPANVYKLLAERSSIIVAADGAANAFVDGAKAGLLALLLACVSRNHCADSLALILPAPTVLIGDMDSVSHSCLKVLQDAGTEILRRLHQDENDLFKALRYLVAEHTTVRDIVTGTPFFNGSTLFGLCRCGAASCLALLEAGLTSRCSP
jgi:hypothetical protein